MLSSIAVRELRSDELGDAAGVLSRGMRDNPLHQQVFGVDPECREAALRRLFTVLLMQYQPKGVVLGAFSPALTGVCAMVRPGRCRPSLREKLALSGAVARRNSVATLIAALRWTSEWARRDPSVSHWHLGPVGVERERQGQGIGKALLGAFAERMDAHGAMSYLETDKRINVAFYERFGFTVRTEAAVLGVPNWFMVRPAAA